MTNTTAPTVTLEWLDIVALMKALSDDRDHWAKLARIEVATPTARRSSPAAWRTRPMPG